MRDSNYRSIANNKAAVTITTSLYDRRALDVTADKPLVNSLNHLTYLVSSSAKVRETLSMDGGIERLVEILHECHNSTFNLSDNIFNSEKKLLTAWKWTLAFQCLVLIGTRGTEKIRQKLVKAGILPIIATVLDNYLTLHERSFMYSGTSQSCQFHVGQPSALANLATQATRSHQFSQTSTEQLEDTRVRHVQQPSPYEQTQNLINQRQQPRPEVQHRQQAFTDTNIQPRQNQEQTTENFAERPSSDFQFTEESVQPISLPNDFSMLDVESNTTALNFPNFDSVNNSNSISNSSQYARQAQNNTISSCIRGLCNNLTSDDYESLTVEQLFKLVQENQISYEFPNIFSSFEDVRKSFLLVNIIEKLRLEKVNESLDCSQYNDCDYDMDCDLQFLNDMFLQNDTSVQKLSFINSKLGPRSFTETGVVIPRDDDIVWSLQLLAYISKYPSLKDVLQNTNLVIDMSIRDKQVKLYLDKQLKSKVTKDFSIKSRPKAKPKLKKNRYQEADEYAERFKLSSSNSPQMFNEINDINEEFTLNGNYISNPQKYENSQRNKQGNVFEIHHVEEDEVGRYNEQELDIQSTDSLTSICDDSENSKEVSEPLVQKLYDEIVKCESIPDDLQRKISQLHLKDKISRTVKAQCKLLSMTIIGKRKERVSYLKDRWDYDSYDRFDIDDISTEEDLEHDNSLLEYKRSNLFPMVEKFTFLAGTDMYYWAGVIMRNSCRRNDAKGGVRQCGNLECGKWEQYPREFSKCRRCKRTKYCSRECQMRAWQCHRNWCIPSTSSSGGTALSSSSSVPAPVQAQEPVRIDVTATPTNND